jgi:tripartite-type tricarboxylate transporter receptor subunit TctC
METTPNPVDRYPRCTGGRMVRIVAAAAATLLAFSDAAAGNYPHQPIRIIVPGAAGVGIDLDARPIAQKMGELLGQQLVIENRPAAGGKAAMEALAKAAPDGYTLSVAGIGQLVVLPYLHRELPFDVDRDFVAISLTQVLPFVLTIHPSLGANSVQELVAKAKAHPGEITFASQGNGSVVHMAGELFKAVTGADLKHIPYGAQNPFTDLAGGHVMAMFSGISPVIGNVKSGKLKILAVSARKRVPVIGDIPTFAEAGLPSYEAGAWNGLVAPRGTPAAIIARLNAEAVKAVHSPEVEERMHRFGGIPIGNSAEEFAAFLRAERAKWGKLIQEARLQLN